MPKEKSKLKALIIFILLEIWFFGVAAGGAQYLTMISLPKAAIFLGLAIMFHLGTALTGLRQWKRELENPISKGDL